MAARPVFPYASELLGVYQPLIGWKGSKTSDRVERETQRGFDDLAEELYQREAGRTPPGAPPASGGGGTWPPNPPRGPGGGDPIPGEPTLTLFDEMAVKYGALWRGNGGRPPTAAEITALVSDASLGAALAGVRTRIEAQPSTSASPTGTGLVPEGVIASIMRALNLSPTPGPTATGATAVSVQNRLLRETATAQALQLTAAVSPRVLAGLFSGRAARTRLKALTDFVDPLATYDPADPGMQAVLSPLCLLQIYRQFFFELDSFLGPSVGNVWLSPGSSVELVEVATRTTLTESSSELALESITRNERTVSERDELSEALRAENRQDMTLGVTSSARTDLGVFQADASGSLSLGNSVTQANETIHKVTRERSEKVSAELRRTYKTTFRRVTEATDTSSRRYLIENKTDKLVNYELRRKMRAVKVQLQHVGTQLCWQIFVDDPGRELGLSDLVHVAAPADLESAPPPEAPAILEPKTTSFQIILPFESMDEREDRTETYVAQSVGNRILGVEKNDSDSNSQQKIRCVWNFAAPAPSGYALADGIRVLSVVGDSPGKDTPEVSPTFKASPGGTFEVTLQSVNFCDHTAITLALELLWTAETENANIQSQYATKRTEFEEQNRRRQYEAYVAAVRERVQLASEVRPRFYDHLREEERVSVYRRLIDLLIPNQRSSASRERHIASELLRSIFDVDRMLYFVAPEWWNSKRWTHTLAGPSSAPSGTPPPPTPLGPTEKLGWGGNLGQKRTNNYLVTEESAPAPLGASLGWVLQLDGDDRRNAFLNAPWVKAVVPVRPGREQAALNWLQLESIEGSEELDDTVYSNTENAAGLGTPGDRKTIREVLDILAAQVTTANLPRNQRVTETVFETGFNPLQGGFQAPRPADRIFDEWTEILPTDQVVAADYVLPP